MFRSKKAKEADKLAEEVLRKTAEAVEREEAGTLPPHMARALEEDRKQAREEVEKINGKAIKHNGSSTTSRAAKVGLILVLLLPLSLCGCGFMEGYNSDEAAALGASLAASKAELVALRAELQALKEGGATPEEVAAVVARIDPAIKQVKQDAEALKALKEASGGQWGHFIGGLISAIMAGVLGVGGLKYRKRLLAVPPPE